MPFVEPHSISGIAYLDGSIYADATVTLTNERTTETLVETTANDGSYIFNLANLTTSGYSNGDIISVVVSGTESNGKKLQFKAVSIVDTAKLKRIQLEYT